MNQKKQRDATCNYCTLCFFFHRSHAKEDQITTRHLILHESPKAHMDEMTMDQIAAFLIGDSGIDLEDLEKRLVRTAMDVAKQNVSKAARLLHLSRPTLRYCLECFGIRS